MGKNYRKGKNQGRANGGKKAGCDSRKQDYREAKNDQDKGRANGQYLSKVLDEYNSNDISYWNKSTRLYEESTKIPFDQIFGNDFPFHKMALDGKANLIDGTIPGVMVFRHATTPGTCNVISDAPNRCFTNLMATLYAKKNASSLPFQQMDLAMWITSLGSIVEGIGHAKKVLETQFFWNDINLMYPKGIIKGCGFNYEDIRDHRFEYVSQLQSLILDFNALYVPDWIDTFDRVYALAHNVWLDEDSSFGQIYTVRPEGYWLYNDTAAPARCDWVSYEYGKAKYTMKEYLNALQAGLDAWRNSSDYYYMAGALRAAFTDTPRFLIAAVDPSKLLQPAKDDTILMQLMNAEFYDPALTENKERWVIKQEPDTNTLVFAPANNQTPYNDTKHALRIFKDKVAPEDIMEMTRMMIGHEQDYAVLPIDVTFGVEVYKFNRRSDNWVHCEITSNVYTYDSDASATIDLDKIQQLQDLMYLQNFRYIPTIYVTIGAGMAVPAETTFLGDVYNYTSMDDSALKKLHVAASYSIYQIKE